MRLAFGYIDSVIDSVRRHYNTPFVIPEGASIQHLSTKTLDDPGQDTPFLRVSKGVQFTVHNNFFDQFTVHNKFFSQFTSKLISKFTVHIHS